MWWFGICIYWEVFPTIRLVNTSFTPHNYHFVIVVFVMVRTLRLYSHSIFQVYNVVLLTTVTMLFITSQNLFILQLEVYTSWPTSTQFSHPSAPGNHHSTFCLWVQRVSRCVCCRNRLAFVPSVLVHWLGAVLGMCSLGANVGVDPNG